MDKDDADIIGRFELEIAAAVDGMDGVEVAVADACIDKPFELVGAVDADACS